MVSITLPDGSVRQFEQPVSVGEVAASIGPGLAKAALGGKVDGKLVDTSHRIDRDAKLAIVTDKDAEGLDLIRHSTAHLLAYAVKELFPEAQVTIGPVIENGFYYDFAYKRPFTPEDLAAIEKRMAEISKKDIPVAREEWKRDDAVKFFESIGEIAQSAVENHRDGAFGERGRNGFGDVEAGNPGVKGALGAILESHVDQCSLLAHSPIPIDVSGLGSGI